MRESAGRMRWISVALVAGCGLGAGAGAGAADASWHPRAYAPPHGRAFHGVSGTVGKERDFQRFRHWVGAHPAVMQDFFPWGTSLKKGALPLWHRTSTRGMLSLTTKLGDREVIRPGEVAHGRGDRYIVKLNHQIAGHRRQVVYIRLFPEMNGHWNPYCAYNADGSARGHGHSTKSFRRAWRRFATIIRGGSVAGINARLHRLGMPNLQRRVGRRLPHPKVAMVWNPQTIGSPAVSGNAPGRYWPGRHYVDWVGADIYAKFPNFKGLNRLYRNYPRKPFLIGEWSPWDYDSPGFVKRLFGWARRHHRVRLLVYYQAFGATNPHHIENYPAAESMLEQELNGRRYDPFAPGTNRPPPEPPSGGVPVPKSYSSPPTPERAAAVDTDLAR